jgi:hypothetical protein
MWTGLFWLKVGIRRGLFVKAVMNIRIPQNVGKLSNGITAGGLSSSAQLI